MDKSVLVMDTPKTCLDCMFCKEIICENGYCNNKPDWCPLKELPKEENGYADLCSFDCGWTAGFNTCLQKINGEK